jgi:hypothetical protein
LWLDVDEVEIPFPAHPVAIGIGFRKVITGIQKQNGNIRLMLPQEMQNHHVFQLKAARQASRAAMMLEEICDYVSSREV